MKKLTLATETLKRLSDADNDVVAGASSGCPSLVPCQPTRGNSCRVCQITSPFSVCNACNPN